MKNILFVDDEQKLLNGLQRMLRPQRRQWDMSFANSGAEALALLATKPFDVVVTDMRMPEMDGARLLELVRERYPGVIRILLSGYVEMEAALRAVPVAHQFLAKPCSPGELCQTIERSCAFAEILPAETLRRVVGAIGRLPALPRTSALLLQAMENPDVSLAEIGRIIEHDVGITAKILQLVNSAFFGLVREVSSVRAAVGYLGLDTLRQLVMSVEIFRTFKPADAIPGFSLEGLEKHSQLAARIASRLPAPQSIVSASVVAALLHDVGKLVLASRLRQEFARVLQMAMKQGRPVFAVEEEVLGTSHAEIGAYLLGLWGLPAPIVQGVCRHHHPVAAEGPARELDILATTHISDALSCELASAEPAGSPDPEDSLLNIEYLARLGLAEELPAWRTMAAQAYQAAQA